LPGRKAYARAVLGGLLLINPRSGRDGSRVAELAASARERGIHVRVLEEGEDIAPAASEADLGTGAIGMAGGDGSMAPVAAVAIDRDLPFVCVPLGTRNHFARDLGVDRGDPVAALDAFDGRERRIDVGRAGDRLFLNNVSIGLYASLVHRRERFRRSRDSLAPARALVRTARQPHRLRVSVDGELFAVRVLLVANNAYELHLFDLGARTELTEGRLHLYSAGGLLPTAWDERVGEQFKLDGGAVLRAAIDGEPVELETPLVCRVEPAALRVLVPPRR
jgi:diacylglycerol kinase family enzyme